jgi:glycosyltransferase involved in cell wall biosynthesis
VRYRLTRALESHVLRRADAVVTICDGLRVEILARGIEASRVHVVPNAVDAAALPMIATRDEALARTLDLGEAIVVGYVGSFYAYEGLELLLRALPVLERSGRRTIAILGGGGPEDARLRALARELGVEHLCRFTGSIPHDQVARYYSLFDACVFPRTRSRLTDLVTPLKPLEAMAQGVLVLASDVGGHRELVSHGRTGLLFAPDSVDAIAGAVGALGQSTDHPEVRRRARAFVEGERTWAHVTRIYPALYERLVARSRTRLAVALDHGDSGRGSPGA